MKIKQHLPSFNAKKDINHKSTYVHSEKNKKTVIWSLEDGGAFTGLENSVKLADVIREFRTNDALLAKAYAKENGLMLYFVKEEKWADERDARKFGLDWDVSFIHAVKPLVQYKGFFSQPDEIKNPNQFAKKKLV